MNTYRLITVQETTLIGTGMSSTAFQIPIDEFNNVPFDYLNKNRIIADGSQMLVFDTEQEYLDYINQI